MLLFLRFMHAIVLLFYFMFIKIECGQHFRISESDFNAGPSSQLNLTVAQVIEAQGFQAKTYQIESIGGYMVAATRIINPMANTTNTKRVVVIHHGFNNNPVSALLTQGPYSEPQDPEKFKLDEETYRSSYDEDNDNDSCGDNPKFIPTKRLKNNCLAYYLSNLGYEVWLLHGRGVTYDSSSYVNSSLEDAENYWNFNLDDQALQDLPAQIDCIRDISKQDKVAYIGFSQSTIFMFQLMSHWPSFAETRLSVYIAIGPEIYKNHVKGGQAEQTVQDEERYKSMNSPVNSLSECIDINEKQLELCPNQTETDSVCRPQYDHTVGPECINIYNKFFMSQYRAPVSSKSAGQMVQYIQKGVFNRFDYGREGNLRYYGQEEAPKYNVSAIKFKKIVLVRSIGNDYVSNAQDQERLISELTVPIFRDIVTPDGYDHYSYFLAYNSYRYVNRPIYETLEEAFSS